MIKTKQQKILIFADHFRPGYKAGGPIQSLVNLVASLRVNYDIYLYNKNHDIHEPQHPYENIEYDTWIKSKEWGVHLYYASPSHQKSSTIKIIIEELNPEYIYLNSFFSPVATIFPIVASLFSKTKSKIILAPRGELKQSALDIKANKKKVYLTAFKLFLKHKVSIWHATNIQESAFIQKKIGVTAKQVVIASNLPVQVKLPLNPITKSKAKADFVMLSRIAPIKNIDFILRILAQINIPMTMDIYGTLEDEKYWNLCKEIIKNNNPKVVVQYKGVLEPKNVLSTIATYRFFISPTKGENFGHSIFEAFVTGLPVIISDQTPWLDLESRKMGYDISLNESKKWLDTIQKCIQCSDDDYAELAKNAWDFANDYRRENKEVKQYSIMFSE